MLFFLCDVNRYSTLYIHYASLNAGKQISWYDSSLFPYFGVYGGLLNYCGWCYTDLLNLDFH